MDDGEDSIFDVQAKKLVLSVSQVIHQFIYFLFLYIQPHSIHPLTDIKETHKGHRSIKYSWPRFIGNLLCIHYVFENSSICS